MQCCCEASLKTSSLIGVLEVLEPVRAGERYSLTVQAMDDNGATSLTVLEVDVTPGPNIQPPFFNTLVYNIQVREMMIFLARSMTCLGL